MSAHTPGPWFQSNRTVYALNQEGFNRFSALVQGSLASEAELIDNAQLMKAAPDMLAALEAILPWIPTTTAADGGAASYSQNVRAADRVRAAIAQARGQS